MRRGLGVSDLRPSYGQDTNQLQNIRNVRECLGDDSTSSVRVTRVTCI